jgi:GNAT superfamily N-acetyltransferase
MRVAADVAAERASTIAVRRLRAVGEQEIDGLTDVLVDCVDGGASISFMRPLSREKALAFWRGVADAVARGERALLVADDVTGIVGTVQLVLDHRRARRRGVGAALLRAAEDAARECGRSLLVLDTASGDAERLYARQGWVRVGVVPDFALLPDGALCDTTFFYRRLDG